MAQVLRPEAGELEVRIEARPEIVFEFFVDPEKMSRWKGTSAEIDPRPGGTHRVGGIAGGATVVGEFVEIDPPRRLVFIVGVGKVTTTSRRVRARSRSRSPGRRRDGAAPGAPGSAGGPGREAPGGLGALRAAARRGRDRPGSGPGPLVDVTRSGGPSKLTVSRP